MKLNERTRMVLAAIEQKPRKGTNFLSQVGRYSHMVNPDVMAAWLADMEEAGYVYQVRNVYHITPIGSDALAVKNTAGTRDYIGSGTYRHGDGDPQQAFYRPGADHSHIKSKGHGC